MLLAICQILKSKKAFMTLNTLQEDESKAFITFNNTLYLYRI